MGDRTDIDALLIGALYGELTPADEARLAAHLESHPADRTALADLSRTREAVRSSRVLAVQVEPPQSVSALLIQEAARRLPRREPGWFYRITRVLMAHPAMAVAAMFVIILGVAGTLHVQRGNQFANRVATPAPASPATASEARSEAVAAPSASADEDMAPEPGGARSSVPSSTRALGQGSSAAQPEALPEGDVDLEEARMPTGRGRGQADGDKGADRNLKKLSNEIARDDIAAPKSKAVVVVPGPEPMPKDLKESNQGAKADSGYLRAREDENKLARAEGARREAEGAGAALPSAPPQSAPPPAAAPAAATVASTTPGVDDVSSTEAQLPARKPSRANRARDPAPQPPSAEEPVAGKFADKPAPAKAEDGASEDKALLGWARKQHEQVVALVKSSKCGEAASLATQIYTRVPDYYAANVATDRSVKPCVSYLNREREREDRSRAASKRGFASEPPASPPPSPSKTKK